MSKISNQRKATYYIGMGMTLIGFLLFISLFFSAFGLMGGFFDNGIGNPFDEGRGNPFGGGIGNSFGRAFIGMLLMIGGQIVSRIGARGAAGSGIILDPERAREDLSPYTEAAGGMINDVISNIDVFDRKHASGETKEIVKIKCRECGALNEEDAKFCKACGKEM